MVGALCTGVPDERLGEALHVMLVPRPGSTLTADALRRWAAERLERYKLPDGIHLADALAARPDRQGRSRRPGAPDRAGRRHPGRGLTPRARRSSGLRRVGRLSSRRRLSVQDAVDLRAEDQRGRAHVEEDQRRHQPGEAAVDQGSLPAPRSVKERIAAAPSHMVAPTSAPGSTVRSRCGMSGSQP